MIMQKIKMKLLFLKKFVLTYKAPIFGETKSSSEDKYRWWEILIQ